MTFEEWFEKYLWWADKDKCRKAWEAANSEIESLRQQLAECQAECKRLDAGWHAANQEAFIAKQATEKLVLESQAREKVLREVLSTIAQINAMDYQYQRWAKDALTLPSDSTALDSAIRQAKREGGHKALLDAADKVAAAAEGQPENNWGDGYAASSNDHAQELRRMAEEMKITDREQVAQDRALLELAAKAAGFTCETFVDGKIIRRDLDNQPIYWNPLTDDGDALRLAVKLHFEVDVWYDGGGVSCALSGTHEDANDGWSFEQSADRYAATRRAIVRAAAEIGKEMK